MTMQPGDVLFHALSAPHGSRNNLPAANAHLIHHKALEIEDWKDPSTRSMTYDAAGIEKIKSFIAERAERGLNAALPPGLSLEADGFTWTGTPATPKWHWRTLGDRYSDEEKAALRDLRQPLAVEN